MTVEFETKLVPLTVRVNAGLPAGMLLGLTEAMAGKAVDDGWGVGGVLEPPPQLVKTRRTAKEAIMRNNWTTGVMVLIRIPTTLFRAAV